MKLSLRKLTLWILTFFTHATYAQQYTVTVNVNNHFHAIDINAPFEVEIKKGSPSVIATIAPELKSKIKFEYKPSGKLIVSTTGDLKHDTSKDALKLSIYMNNLDLIQAASASKIDVESGFDSNSLNIDLSSAAKLTGQFNVQNNVKIDCSSASKADITLHAKNVTVDCSSTAKVDLKGTCQHLNVDTSSASKVDAEALYAEQVKASSSSASKISVRAKQKFWLEASSASRISYCGEGTVESANASSAASISRK